MALPRFAIALFLAAFAALASAAPADFDRTFGNDGRVILDGVTSASLTTVALQPDRKILAAGSAIHPGMSHAVVARFHPDGALDTAFGTNGVARPYHDEGLSTPHIALQPDGKIVLAARRACCGPGIRVLRLNTDGTIDTTFGTNGFTFYEHPGLESNLVAGVALQPDGRIVVTTVSGKAYPSPFPGGGMYARSIAVARLLPSGVMDTSFDGDGLTAHGDGTDFHAQRVSIAPDGKVVVSGYVNNDRVGGTYPNSAFVARFNADGSLDTGFGGSGVVSRTFTRTNPIQGLAIQPDGKIVTGTSDRNTNGGQTSSFEPEFVVNRYALDGTLDATFGNGGETRLRLNTRDMMGDIMLAPDGKIWLTGIAWLGDTPQLAIVRFNTNGTLDASWRGTGYATLSMTPTPGSDVLDALLQPDGRVLMGLNYDAAGNGDARFMLMRVDSNFATTSTLASDRNPANRGEPVTLTASVMGGETFTGTFSFKDGAAPIAGCESVAVTGYRANCVTSSLPTGTRQLTAVYSGDEMFMGSTSPVLQQVVNGGGPADDDDGDGVPNAVEPGEGLNPFVKDNDVFASARLFSMQQYRDFLGREGDAAGVDFHTQSISSGASTRPGVIEQFLGSAEFQSGLPQCTRLYFSFFLRIPDYAGLMFQIGQFRAGVPLETISQNFSNSPEFTNRYGSLDNGQYVDLVYQNVLGRPADPEGRQYYLDRLNDGRLTRGQMMIGFSESPEFQQIIENEVYVTAVYVGMLRRAPDPAGMDFYVNQIEGGSPRNGIINGFLGAPEYRARFLP